MKKSNTEQPSTEGVAPIPALRSSKETLEVFGKIAIGLVGLCYVLGLIVVTIHLRKYGLNSLDLPQLHYVMAGVWAILPILLTVLMIIFGAYMYQVQVIDEPASTGWKRLRKIFEVVLVLLVAFYFVLKFLGGNLGLDFGWKSWVFIPLIGAFAAVSISAGVFLLTRPDGYSSIGMLSINLGAIVFGLCLGLLYLVTFSNNTYQKIPWSTGGGRPSQVQLMIDPQSKPYLEGVGLRLTNAANMTEPTRLLMTTEKEVVLINANGDAVSIPVGTVKSIVYEK
ncbi:MAG TPA: hypothetical protein VJU86_22140 [Pyrinomonadaceae bacterium]|nr:hypothetical protein [Pyrinomonadaceae bacterium]